MDHKYVYMFSEGNGGMRELLGGKGANLAEMTSLSMPVPHGFTITTEACSRYYNDGLDISDEIRSQINTSIKEIERISGKRFGDPKNPLLLSVRSGARVSMPGMMDTILNLGINSTVVQGLAEITGNRRFAYDSYRRFIQMFSDVVMELSKSDFENVISDTKKNKGIKFDTELSCEDLEEIVEKFKLIYKEKTKSSFPQDPQIQLMEAIRAVFRSWDNQRANVYRRMNGIPYSWGTAVNVQMMVFGNFGEKSGTGVAFSRNPATGENRLFGEYLINAQGEDVVAGVRTPMPIESLRQAMPLIYEQFSDIARSLENHYTDMQDMEFTIEDGKLYMLQTRSAKRTAAAALKIAVDLVKEGKISKDEAVMRVEPRQLDSLLHPQFEKKALKNAVPIGKGLAASPGAACGKVAFSAEEAKQLAKKGEKVVLVRLETSPEDIEGMAASQGILTVRGGMTSHAAVVARGMGTCCVSGCGDININEDKKLFELGGKIVKQGEYISLDGSTGFIYFEKINTIPADISGDFETIMKWSDSERRLKVLTNADTPADVRQAVSFGAEGVGLCRTEHMFFEDERIKAVREMIVSKTTQGRKKALEKLLPYQKKDFVEMFRELKGLPMTIRFLDPPLHEFLPEKEEDVRQIANEMEITYDELRNIISSLHEFNPMMGHRGCRLSVSYPEIARMQTCAVIGAAIEVMRESPEYKLVPEIMIPLVGELRELKFVKDIITKQADILIKESGINIQYRIGTMIEIPRAALMADKIAKEAEFFSFGTNDLTQMTFGFSRDDAAKFLDYYYQNKIYESDPFEHIDIEGVGKLVKESCSLGRKTRPDIKLGICGEHGGDPLSIDFFDRTGLDYVSCSPFRVPVARLAAAQSNIRIKREKG